MTRSVISLRLSELNRSHPATWSWQTQTTLFVMVMVMTTAASWYLHLQPALNLQEHGDRALRTLITSYAEKYPQTAALPSLQQHERALAHHLAHLERQLSLGDDVASVLSDISEAAHRHGLLFDMARPGDPASQHGVSGRPVNLHLSGPYHAIGRFAADIAAMPRLLVLSTMRLTAADSPGLVTLEAIIMAYHHPLSGDDES